MIFNDSLELYQELIRNNNYKNINDIYCLFQANEYFNLYDMPFNENDLLRFAEIIKKEWLKNDNFTFDSNQLDELYNNEFISIKKQMEKNENE